MKNIIDKNIVKVKRDNMEFTRSMDYDIRFWAGGRYESVDISDFLDTLIELNQVIANKKLTEQEILVSFAKSEIGIKTIWDKYLEEYEQDVYDNDINIFELHGQFEIASVMYDIIELDDFKALAGLCNCKFGTVGYSPWAYFLAWEDVEEDFIRDLYEGWNFYQIEKLSASGETLDAIGEVYAPDTEALLMNVLDFFRLDKGNFYLVDNEESSQLDIEKVREVENTIYSYERIDK